MVDKPTLSVFTGTEGLGTIYKEQNQINCKFFDFNVVGTTTEGRTSANVFGKSRIIILQGAHDGTGFDGVGANDKIAEFVWTMEQWVNAGIQTHRIYKDSLDNSYNVDAIDWSWTRTFDQPNRILYVLLMKQS